jgi:uncharacterized protein (TIGR02996 family)
MTGVAHMLPWRRKPRPEPPPDTPELRAFLDAIRREPFDDAPKLQLADWLDEHAGEFGRSRAELIRLQCAHAAFRPLEECLRNNHGGMLTPELSDFYRRLRFWHRRYGNHPTYRTVSTDRGGLILRVDVWSLSYGGWSEWVRSDRAAELARFQQWLEEAPYRWAYQVVADYQIADDVLSRLASLPMLKGIRRIYLRCEFLGDGVTALHGSPHLERGTELFLSPFFDDDTAWVTVPLLGEEVIDHFNSRYGDRILFSSWRSE